MNPVNNNQKLTSSNDEIDLAELWHAIWDGKYIVIFISIFFAIASILYAISQPNIYRASTLLAPTGEQGGAGGLAKMAGQFGGLASLAGINLGSGGTNKAGLALEILKSRVFLEGFIEKHNLLVPLVAVNDWNQIEDKFMYDEEIYDQASKKWIRDVSPPKTVKPSKWESFEAFVNIFSISEDKETGMITLTIEYYSPIVAKQWLTWLVEDINATMREQDKKEAQNSIDFLSKKLHETQLADMQKVFYQLIEEQTKTIMLAEVTQEYVLKTIDPANAPDNKSKPKRALIVILSVFFGAFVGIFIALIRYFSRK